MAEATSNNNAGGGTVMGLLGVAFVVLKLCHVINWSWWWVTAPFWGPIVLVLIILLIFAAVWLVNDTRRSARYRR